MLSSTPSGTFGPPMSVLTRIVRFASASTPSSAMGGERAYRRRAGNSRNRPETGHSALRVPPHHHPKRPYAKRSSSACASAISGISGVGEKPSSAGARTAWASFGRPVDW